MRTGIVPAIALATAGCLSMAGLQACMPTAEKGPAQDQARDPAPAPAKDQEALYLRNAGNGLETHVNPAMLKAIRSSLLAKGDRAKAARLALAYDTLTGDIRGPARQSRAPLAKAAGADVPATNFKYTAIYAPTCSGWWIFKGCTGDVIDATVQPGDWWNLDGWDKGPVIQNLWLLAQSGAPVASGDPAPPTVFYRLFKTGGEVTQFFAPAGPNGAKPGANSHNVEALQIALGGDPVWQAETCVHVPGAPFDFPDCADGSNIAGAPGSGKAIDDFMIYVYRFDPNASGGGLIP